jgi:hypothetical protein
MIKYIVVIGLFFIPTMAYTNASSIEKKASLQQEYEKCNKLWWERMQTNCKVKAYVKSFF